MKAAEHRVAGGSDFLWECFGTNARWIEFADINDQEFADAVYDTVNNRVYQINVHVPGTDDNRCVTWIDPEFEHAYVEESRRRKINPYQAWDNVMYSTVPGSEESMILDLLNDGAMRMYDHFPAAKYVEEVSGDRTVLSEHVGVDVLDDDGVSLPDPSKSYVAQFTVRYTMVVEAEDMSTAAAKARKTIDSFTDYAPVSVVEVVNENIGSA